MRKIRKRRLETLTAQNIECGKKYAFGDGWMKVESFQIMSDKEMLEKELNKPVRVTAILDNDDVVEFGIDM